jgi:ubiquinone/menaquinone biosynthesis C-methylase UbiE
MGLDFTGERYVPSIKGQIYYEHLHRYAIAERMCAGKRVLDLACGEGFGAAFLARRAATVVGVDIDGETLVHARRMYYQANLRFLTGSASSIPLPDASVDVVVSFETIEHLDDHEAMLAEFQRVLTPGGVLFISSPNKLVYSDKAKYHNPFHVHELYYEEFRDLLQRRFPNVAIYGQQLVASSVLHPLGGALSEMARWYSGNVERIDLGLPTLSDPVYFIAACSAGRLPDEIASSFVDPHDDLLEHIRLGIEADIIPLRAAPIRRAIAPPSSEATAFPTRVMLACAPKSGSTYVANTLARYFDTRFGNSELHEMQWEAEQNLNRALLDELGDGSYVLQFHLKPYPLNFALMHEFGIELALQWRNLGDAIVSLDEHMAEFGEQQPLCYIHDKGGFLALPAQSRYQYLIRHALQWYIGFYLAWRKERRAFGVYERMVEDPLAYFKEIITRLGRNVDAARLTDILETPTGFLRLNVGRVGRSAELFSEETKRLLEDVVLDEPWSGQLDILLWELPWEVPALAALTEYDGTIVATADDPTSYFVSRGARRRLPNDSGAWLASRTRLRDRAARIISSAALDAIPEAAALT